MATTNTRPPSQHGLPSWKVQRLEHHNQQQCVQRLPGGHLRPERPDLVHRLPKRTDVGVPVDFFMGLLLVFNVLLIIDLFSPSLVVEYLWSWAEVVEWLVLILHQRPVLVFSSTLIELVLPELSKRTDVGVRVGLVIGLLFDYLWSWPEVVERLVRIL